MDWSPPFPWPTHTCLRIPFKIKGRDFMVVTDEDVVRLEGCPPYPSSFMWMVDQLVMCRGFAGFETSKMPSPP